MDVVRRCAQSPPFDARSGREILQRRIHATSALAALGRLGWDFDALYRSGLGRSVAGLVNIFTGIGRDRLPPDASSTGPAPCILGWHEALDASAAGEGAGTGIHPLIESWLATAPLEDLIAWTPPRGISTTQVGQISLPDASGEYRWAVDRLTRTYLTDWADDSLELEHRLKSGLWEPDHVPVEQVQIARQVRDDDLNRVIAERAIHHGGVADERLRELTENAISAIKAGRPDAAASIFETARKLHPTNPKLANNLGFCLIPLDPGAAVANLRDAERLGFAAEGAHEAALLACNLALALTRLGDAATATATATAGLANIERAGRSLPPGEAFLWSLDPDSDEVVTADVADYLRELLRRTAS